MSAPAPAASAAPVGYASVGSDPLSSAPAKKWQPYGGYDPKSRGPPSASSAASAPSWASSAASAPAVSTDPLSSAPAKKWQPYGGYDPKNRGAPAASSAP